MDEIERTQYALNVVGDDCVFAVKSRNAPGVAPHVNEVKVSPYNGTCFIPIAFLYTPIRCIGVPISDSAVSTFRLTVATLTP